MPSMAPTAVGVVEAAPKVDILATNSGCLSQASSHEVYSPHTGSADDRPRAYHEGPIQAKQCFADFCQLRSPDSEAVLAVVYKSQEYQREYCEQWNDGASTSPAFAASLADHQDSAVLRAQQPTAAFCYGLCTGSLPASDWLADEETQKAVIEMLEEEIITEIDANYLDYHGPQVQDEKTLLTAQMRCMAVNWMSEAVADLGLDQTVMAMAVTLLDRYLSIARQFPRTMLQLAAAVAIFIAAKIEGVLPHPPGSRVAELSAGLFGLDELVAFERVMCHSLSFDLYGPSAQNFLTMWLHCLPRPSGKVAVLFLERVRLLASYILELGSLVYELLRRRRSIQATAALLLALANTALVDATAREAGAEPAQLWSWASYLVSNVRCCTCPDIDVSEVTSAAAELLHLHRLAHLPENAAQFVNIKFSEETYDCVATVAKPMSNAAYHALMNLYLHD